jgi:diaminohydroxyphosphoribosylaminopyrimidine deaminase/5-amino-6-(5-phosphoribosylamino)uracil reductase
MNATDEKLMRVALRLARRGLGRTRPNPAVGAVVVQGGRVVGRGWHARAGSAHAEALALAIAGERARGATLYVTLEPCSHSGRTPPCTDAILAARVRRVVAAMRDPNPLVDGRGIALLRRRGVRVDVGCLEAEARELNAGFIKRITTGLPLVTLKAALTLDGRIATSTGESQWITGADARRYTHRLRAESDAIAVGLGTVLTDDPRLTVRGLPATGGSRARRGTQKVAPERSAPLLGPDRIVFDTMLRTPTTARLLRERGSRVILVCADDAPRARRERLERAGALVLAVPRARKGAGVSLRHALRALGRAGINAILLEGGSRLATSFLADRLVDRVALFYAPVMLGGTRPLTQDLGIERLARALRLRDMRWRQIGDDILVEGRL